ncbi:MAG TPA: hypothetical protein PLH19_14220 [Anaerolineae bacterium]|nr:hypothetical protein [Anaerolineae bacterium]HQH39672.1 hypothetical protein [Anaerolineae bacterium]
MISPQLGRAAFRIIMFVIVISLILLLSVTPGSAEFVVSGITLTVGVCCGVVLFVLVRRQPR